MKQNKMEYAEIRHTPFSSKHNVLFPFVYTTMDAACLAQTQLIFSTNQQRSENGVSEMKASLNAGMVASGPIAPNLHIRDRNHATFISE